MFVAAGTGGEGLSTLEGYKLKPESPCINAGMPMPFVDHDFWGNPIKDGSIDIGVFEQIGSGVFGDPKVQEELNQTEKARLGLIWAKKIFPQRIVVPEEGGEVTISLSEPLSKDISGTINIDGLEVQPRSIVLGNEERENFIFQAKPINNLNTSSSVSAILKMNGLEEKLELPVYYSRVRPLKSMDKYKIDGNLDEWSNISSLDINAGSQVLSDQATWTKPDDGSCSFKTAVSGNHLLLSINVVDGQIITEGANNDHLEIYYRDMNSGQGRMFRGGSIILPVQQENGKMEGFTLRVGRREVPVNNDMKTYYKTHQNGYTMELSIPFHSRLWALIPSRLKAVKWDLKLC